jgi:hypothetical protein
MIGNSWRVLAQFKTKMNAKLIRHKLNADNLLCSNTGLLHKQIRIYHVQERIWFLTS